MNSTLKKSAMAIALVTVIAVYPEDAYAQALFDSGTNFLNALMDLLTNTWARILAIIAVVCLGVMWMTGRLAWYAAVSVIGGMILVFGAPAIVDSLAGSL